MQTPKSRSREILQELLNSGVVASVSRDEFADGAELTVNLQIDGMTDEISAQNWVHVETILRTVRTCLGFFPNRATDQAPAS